MYQYNKSSCACLESHYYLAWFVGCFLTVIESLLYGFDINITFYALQWSVAVRYAFYLGQRREETGQSMKLVSFLQWEYVNRYLCCTDEFWSLFI